MSGWDESAAMVRLEAARLARQREQEALEEARRPSTRLRPAVCLDGDMWCALYGENLQEGVAGFGKTPEEACVAFDKAWTEGQP